MNQHKRKKSTIFQLVKGIWNKRISDSRRKGAILVEFIVAVPIFMMLVWGVMNLMLYLLATSTLNEAAYESSRAIAVEMRGEEGTMIEDYHVQNVRQSIEVIVDRDNFLKTMSDGNEPVFAYSADECRDASDEKNLFCAYVESYMSNGKSHQQVVVYMKSGFDMIGSFIPVLGDSLTVKAKSVAQKELADRYNYIN